MRTSRSEKTYTEFATSACSEKGTINPSFIYHFVCKGITFLSIVPPHLVKTQRSPLAGRENPYLFYSRGQNKSAILRLAVEPSLRKQFPILASEFEICGSARRLTSLKEFNDSFDPLDGSHGKKTTSMPYFLFASKRGLF